MPRIVRVELLLSDGHWRRLNLEEDSEQIRALLGALAARSQGASEISSQILQIPLDGGRSALSFMTHDVVAMTTRPPVLVLPEALSRETSTQEEPPFAASVRPMRAVQINEMEITQVRNEPVFLFLDLFVHWSRKKITAVVGHYGDDVDWRSYGVDYDHITMTFGPHSVRGHYIPHRLDSWEPSSLLDFEHPDLESYIRDHANVSVEISAGPHRKQFNLTTDPTPAFEVALSVVVRDENRWIRYFLDYYLLCTAVQHVYVYDNKTADGAALRDILRPYCEKGQVTYIPWHHRWRNSGKPQMFAQPAQEAHALNRYGTDRWIGFFDIDEFLRTPGKTIPEFLAQYDARAIGGLSFGMRWFMYKGLLDFDEIGNPLTTFLHSKRDSLGRKRQKLFVSPQNVRFARLHWLEENACEIAVDDAEVFFHHYCLNELRFEEGKTARDTTYDDYMLRFAERFDDGEKEEPVQPIQTAPMPRTQEEWIAHIVRAFGKAEQSSSRLTGEVLSIQGMCGVRTRHLYNNICNFDGCRLLEIGCHAGASTCSALFGNRVSAICVDNWSEFGNARDRFLENVERYRGESSLRLLEEDCFTVDRSRIGTFDVFLYDGNHQPSSHYKALAYYYDNLEERAVVVIDDWNWKGVRDGTRKAIQELDIPVIFEREIILPPEEVAGMPRHPGQLTWWNGIYVMLIDKSTSSRRLSPRHAGRSVWSSDHVSHREERGVKVIIFSKDRACQLDALLRSMDAHLKVRHERYVLYTASSCEYELAYEQLVPWYEKVHWVRETHFKNDLMRLLCNDSTSKIMFLVDDIVFTRDFDRQDLVEDLDAQPDILAISLRMGENIGYCYTRNVKTTPPDFTDGYRWAWRSASPGYWNYPMSVDGNIYRTRDIVEHLGALDFHSPNTLEARMAGRPIDKPYMKCDRQSFLVNLALNIVQDDFQNRHGDISAASLNHCFLEGFAIDIEPLTHQTFDSCHIETQIKLYSHNRPMTGRQLIPDGPAQTAPRSGDLIADENHPRRNGCVLEQVEGRDSLLIAPGSKKGFQLNESSRAIWALCDGSRKVAEIVEMLQQQYSGRAGDLRSDVLSALSRFAELGLVSIDSEAPLQHLDLRDITFYVINCKGDDKKREFMKAQLEEKGLRYVFVDGVKCTPHTVGITVSHLKALKNPEAKVPFAILEDDCQFMDSFRYEFDLPADADALYLGVSLFGIKEPGEFSWAVWNGTRYTHYDASYLRVLNMLSRHAIVFLSHRFRQNAIEASIKALTNPPYPYPADIGYAMLHASHLVLTPVDPICYQSEKFKGNHTATKHSLKILAG